VGNAGCSVPARLAQLVARGQQSGRNNRCRRDAGSNDVGAFKRLRLRRLFLRRTAISWLLTGATGIAVLVAPVASRISPGLVRQYEREHVGHRARIAQIYRDVRDLGFSVVLRARWWCSHSERSVHAPGAVVVGEVAVEGSKSAGSSRVAAQLASSLSPSSAGDPGCAV
jgi:hypothetical protein